MNEIEMPTIVLKKVKKAGITNLDFRAPIST